MHSRSVPSVLVFVAGCALTVVADTYPRQPAVDALHYRFNVTVSDESLSAASRISVQSSST
jgi:hypothetical protein